MSLATQIIDQQVSGIIERYADDFANELRLGHDEHKRRSAAFVFLVARAAFDLTDQETMDGIVDGSNDFGRNWSATVGDYALAGGWTLRGEALVVGDAAGGVYRVPAPTLAAWTASPPADDCWLRRRTVMCVSRSTLAAMFTSRSMLNLLIFPLTSSLTRERGTPKRLAASAWVMFSPAT